METEKLTAFLLETLKDTKQFVAEQAPDYVQQLLQYAAVAETSGLIVSLIIFIGLVYCVIKVDDTEVKIAISILALVSLIFVFGGASELYKIKYAPKVYLMEQITKGRK